MTTFEQILEAALATKPEPPPVAPFEGLVQAFQHALGDLPGPLAAPRRTVGAAVGRGYAMRATAGATSVRSTYA